MTRVALVVLCALAGSAFASEPKIDLPDNHYASDADQLRRTTAADVKASAKQLLPSSKLVFSLGLPR